MLEFFIIYLLSIVLVILIHIFCCFIVTKRRGTKLAKFIKKYIMDDEDMEIDNK
jgi:hypothetical protein